jgi:nitroreductase
MMFPFFVITNVLGVITFASSKNLKINPMIIESLKWRYATKKFDNTRTLAAEDLNELKEAVNLTASSYGLQPYVVLDVQNPEIRAKLRAASWDQSQITDASSIFVFCAANDMTAADIDSFIELTATTRGLEVEALKGYADFMKGAIGSRTQEQKYNWNARQAYIALGNLLTVAATKGIDTCPMEGFDPVQYNEILGLNESGYSAVVVAAIGYRSTEDGVQHNAKVRKPLEVLFRTV